ncbi:MAG: RNHCP domain-containing protein [Patescibacteria group bacterium]
MIPINDPFVCQKCGEQNPPAGKSYRNHCRRCLCSLHVDEGTPGDRMSTCRGLMFPVAAGVHSRKEYEITHECVKCGKRIPNKAAPDDNMDLIIKLSANHAL